MPETLGFRDGMIEADLTELTGKRFGSTRRVGEPWKAVGAEGLPTEEKVRAPLFPVESGCVD